MAESAAIKAIEASTVHQIQSGQVIVDLCSVAKELVENSVDAGATSIDVRFKNQGLDSIEVQDNGSGISPNNYEGLALKHYTSKLSSYADLDSLQTFGFRGEALSSLCALSDFTVVTCLQADVPRGTKLAFDVSGRLKDTGVVATQKGTIVVVENLFKNLPVRRRELERNIKREWNKVVSLLNQYACIMTGIKFAVSQQPSKGKRIILFSTKGNPTTRDNIINIFGAKTLNALIPLDLTMELAPTVGPTQRWASRDSGGTREIRVCGHVSRPAHGEGRQTPDRQMFYVNGRPCQLPQFAKVFNEVYKSYNASQSPFIFADLQLDTHLYDVNVSPDKRTILLHDQGRMLDTLKENLVELFEKQDITVPIAQHSAQKSTPFKKLGVKRPESHLSESSPGTRAPKKEPDLSQQGNQASALDIPAVDSEDGEPESDSQNAQLPDASGSSNSPPEANQRPTIFSRWAESEPDAGADRITRTDEELDSAEPVEGEHDALGLPGTEEKGKARLYGAVPTEDATSVSILGGVHGAERHPSMAPSPSDQEPDSESFGDERAPEEAPEPQIPSIPTPSRKQGSVATSMVFTRPPKRSPHEPVTITIGGDTTTGLVGSPLKRPRLDQKGAGQRGEARAKAAGAPLPSFGGRLSQMFAAFGASERASSDTAAVMPGTEDSPDEDHSSQEEEEEEEEEDEEEEEEEEEDEEEEEAEEEEGEGEEEGGREEEEGEEAEEEEAEEEPSTEPEVAEDWISASLGQEQATDMSEEQSLSAGSAYDDDGDGAEKSTVQPSIEEVAAGEAVDNPSEDSQKRSQLFLKGATSRRKDSTVQYTQYLKVDEASIKRHCAAWTEGLRTTPAAARPIGQPAAAAAAAAATALDAADAEEKLSLVVSKADFAQMKVVGQFNLGFVLAVREAEQNHTGKHGEDDAGGRPVNHGDELFIIDQHASDEKYNFERLQANTIVQSQRLVHPKQLELTAVEEEIVMENLPALEANGFIVKVDESGAEPVGLRCRLLSLPLSRETTFSISDLEELISILGEGCSATTVPRPSTVRKMFAMRACRSSIMIGKALTQGQMEKVVRHMGEMEKPWNCPHGRPTMRHLASLAAWDAVSWNEGDGFDDWAAPTDWQGFMRGVGRCLALAKEQTAERHVFRTSECK